MNDPNVIKLNQLPLFNDFDSVETNPEQLEKLIHLKQSADELKDFYPQGVFLTSVDWGCLPKEAHGNVICKFEMPFRLRNREIINRFEQLMCQAEHVSIYPQQIGAFQYTVILFRIYNVLKTDI